MTVLCYHAVDPAWCSPRSTSPERFKRHRGWLARNRRVMKLDGAVERIDARGRLPNNLCAITFDDGLASLHEHALASLSEQKLPATVFVVAATLEPQP